MKKLAELIITLFLVFLGSNAEYWEDAESDTGSGSKESNLSGEADLDKPSNRVLPLGIIVEEDDLVSEQDEYLQEQCSSALRNNLLKFLRNVAALNATNSSRTSRQGPEGGPGGDDGGDDGEDDTGGNQNGLEVFGLDVPPVVPQLLKMVTQAFTSNITSLESTYKALPNVLQSQIHGAISFFTNALTGGPPLAAKPTRSSYPSRPISVHRVPNWPSASRPGQRPVARPGEPSAGQVAEQAVAPAPGNSVARAPIPASDLAATSALSPANAYKPGSSSLLASSLALTASQPQSVFGAGPGPLSIPPTNNFMGSLRQFYSTTVKEIETTELPTTPEPAPVLAGGSGGFSNALLNSISQSVANRQRVSEPNSAGEENTTMRRRRRRTTTPVTTTESEYYDEDTMPPKTGKP